MKTKKIGIALGAGAARGFAHLGVLQVFEEEHIPVDFVSGSSIGALIGALYCSGMNTCQIIELAEKIEPWHWIDLTVPKKGLISGDRIEEMLRRYTAGSMFDELRIPLSVVATDLYSGEKRVIDSGYVYQAVRASIAIPGIFKPVETGGMLLVDGGLRDPVPTEVVRKMGADIVAGVDLGAVYERDSIHDIYHIIIRSIDIMQNQINNLRRVDADVLIQPDLRTINPITFNQVKKCVEEGRRAAESVIRDLKDKMCCSPKQGWLKSLVRKRNT